MKAIVFAVLASITAFAATADVDVYSPQQLQSISKQLAGRKTAFASQPLQKYGNHYTMVAFRQQTGSSEVHEKESDIFIIENGTPAIITGGKLVDAHTEKPGELRGSSIQGGTRQVLPTGSVIHIPAGVPHQLLVTAGDPVTYFVVKVIEP